MPLYKKWQRTNPKTMNTTDSLPKHNLGDDYPFMEPVSLQIYPANERLGQILHIDKGIINMNREAMEIKFGLKPNSGDNEFDRAYYLGITDRLLKAEQALQEAEHQVRDTMKDLPFIPEAFCFEVVQAPQSIEEDPITIYKSKLTSGILLSRVIGKSNNWIVMRDGVKIEFHIPCERVAFHVFYALGIPVKEEIPAEEPTEEGEAQVVPLTSPSQD